MDILSPSIKIQTNAIKKILYNVNVYNNFINDICKDININTIIKKINKKSLLHCHYSSIISNKNMLLYVLFTKKFSFKYMHNKGEVHVEKKNNSDNKNTYDAINLKIKNTMNLHDIKKIFKIIGNLWYDVIKNIDFFNKYHKLIINEMNIQNISHIELRLAFNSHYKILNNEYNFSN